VSFSFLKFTVSTVYDCLLAQQMKWICEIMIIGLHSKYESFAVNSKYYFEAVSQINILNFIFPFYLEPNFKDYFSMIGLTKCKKGRRNNWKVLFFASCCLSVSFI